jgi:hypothetical protein
MTAWSFSVVAGIAFHSHYGRQHYAQPFIVRMAMDPHRTRDSTQADGA